MKKLFSTRKRIVIVCVAGGAVVLGSAGAAYAYYTASGSGTGTSSAVGSTGTWQVTKASTSGTAYPGSGSSTIVFTVKNTGTGDQQFSTVTPTVNSSSGNITSSGTAVSGCLASWFSVSVTSDSSLSTNIAGGATASVTVTLTMPSNSTTNQDTCEGAAPDVSLAVS